MFKTLAKFKGIAKSVVISNSLKLSPKLSFYNPVCKFVSGNPQSKVNRENRELDKIEKFWDQVDKKVKERTSLEKQVEAKYKIETFFVGKQTQPSPNEDKSVEVYYVPLTREDANLLQAFNKQTAEKIQQGGRLVLLNEVTNFNRSQPIEKHLVMNPPFEPLSSVDIVELQSDFYELYANEKVFNFILQNGKKMFEELKQIRDQKVDKYLDYLNKLNYIDHYSEVINNFPFNTKIAIEFQKYEDPHFVKYFLSNKKVDEVKLTEHLKNIYFDFYKQIEEALKIKKENQKSEDKGLNKISDSLEPCLFDRINTFVDYLKLNNLSFTFTETKDSLSADKEQYYIFEKLFFKGVCLNRYANDEPEDYILVDSHEDLGMRYYLHKFLTGDAGKVHSKKSPLTSAYEFNSDEFHNSLDFQVKERNRKIVLRVYLFLKHPYRVQIANEKDNANLLDYSSNYTHNHLAVFENELVAPHHTYLVNNDFENWLSKHKLNLKDWKLVDVDNFMKGNPFFIKKSLYQDNFEQIVNDDQYTLKILQEKFPDIKNPEAFLLPPLSKKEEKKGGKKGKDSKDGKNSKEAKEETPNTTLINSLEFDYRVSKIARPYQEPNEYSKELEEVEKEYKRLMDAELRKNSALIEKNANKEAEMRRELSGDLNNPQKLERLAKIYAQDKKERTKVEINMPETFAQPIQLDGEGKLIPQIYNSELERLLNQIILKNVADIFKKGGRSDVIEN